MENQKISVSVCQIMYNLFDLIGTFWEGYAPKRSGKQVKLDLGQVNNPADGCILVC